MTHDLKTDPEAFDAVARGEKTFEIRKDDRDYQVGDTLLLRRTRYTGEQMHFGSPLEYTGEQQTRKVTHLLRGPIYGLHEGWVILSLEHMLPVVDDKTPAEVAYSAMEEHQLIGTGLVAPKWDQAEPYVREKYTRMASAVLTAFSRAGLEAAIARMEAVPLGEQMRYKREAEARAEKAEEEAATEKRKRLYAEEQLGILAKTFGYEGRTWCNMVSYLCPRLQKAEAEIARVTIERNHAVNAEKLAHRNAKLSTLRPISESGPVPAGCVRVTGYWNGDRWNLGIAKYSGDTHFADILLPAVEAEKPADTFEAHGKTWNVHVQGDPRPCDGEASIMVLFSGGREAKSPYRADDLRWNKLDSIGDIIGWRYADEPTPEPVKPWTTKVGDANPVQDMALGGQMYWRDLAHQLAEVWWKCHNIGASLQHGDIDTDVSFSVVCEKHGGQVFHADTPRNAWLKAEKWLMSPDRENFPAVSLQAS